MEIVTEFDPNNVKRDLLSNLCRSWTVEDINKVRSAEPLVGQSMCDHIAS